MHRSLWLCTYAENHAKLSFQNFQTHIHSIKHSPWPTSLTPPVQAIGVRQSTFRMWFIIANITIHLMAIWSFHNDSAGSALIMLKDCWGGAAWSEQSDLRLPQFSGCTLPWWRPQFSIHHHSETGSDVKTRVIYSSNTACTKNGTIQDRARSAKSVC